MLAAAQETSRPVCCGGGGGGSADVPESRPACLPQVKHLIPAAPRLVSRVNSVRRSDQNNEGLCGRAPRGGREREPRTAVRGRDWAQAQEREPCADAALGDTHARRGRGGPSAHDAELRLRPHPPPAEDAPRMRTGASVNSPGAGGRRAGEWGLEGQAGTAMPPRVTAFQELWAVENPGLWPVEAQKEATCGHPTPPSRRLLVAGIS